MNTKQTNHIDKMIAWFSRFWRLKYAKGTIEHSGLLWNVRNVLGMALEEVADQASYLLTLRQQIEDIGELISFYRDNLDKKNPAYPMINDIYNKFQILLPKPIDIKKPVVSYSNQNNLGRFTDLKKNI